MSARSPENNQVNESDIVDGKVNWRSWVPYPEGLTEEIKELLDQLSEFPDLIDNIKPQDNLEKFDMFTKRSLQKGLINNDEYLTIQQGKHRAA